MTIEKFINSIKSNYDELLKFKNDYQNRTFQDTLYLIGENVKDINETNLIAKYKNLLDDYWILWEFKRYVVSPVFKNIVSEGIFNLFIASTYIDVPKRSL